MALAFNGTKNSQRDNQIASGYTRPVVVEFDDFKYTRQFDLLIDKTTVDDPTPSTTLDNIYDDAAIGINKQLTDILNLDFDTGALAVDAWADCLNITTDLENNINTEFYKNTATEYKATVILYTKTP